MSARRGRRTFHKYAIAIAAPILDAVREPRSRESIAHSGTTGSILRIIARPFAKQIRAKSRDRGRKYHAKKDYISPWLKVHSAIKL